MRVARKNVTPQRWIPVLVGLMISICTGLVQAKSAPDAQTSPTMSVAELPREGQETYQLIRKGGYNSNKICSSIGNNSQNHL